MTTATITEINEIRSQMNPYEIRQHIIALWTRDAEIISGIDSPAEEEGADLVALTEERGRLRREILRLTTVAFAPY